MKNIFNILKDEYSFTAFIPSLREEKKYSPLSVAEYNELYQKCFIVNEPFNLVINNFLNDSNLTVFDRDIILPSIRYYNISTKFKNIDFSHIIEKCNKAIHPEPRTFQREGYNVTCQVPSLELESYNINFNKNTFLNKEQKLLLLISSYITDLKHKNNAVSIPLNYKDKIKFLKTLPVRLLADIIEYKDNIDNKVLDIYRVNDSVFLPRNSYLLVD